MIDKLKPLVADIFDVDPENIDKNFSRVDCEAWDSFNHLLFISEIEKVFDVRFSVSEVENLNSIESVICILTQKCS